MSFRRSSKGKSNRVASILVVSSMETLSTQSKVTPSEGSASRISAACPRMTGSSNMRFLGDTTPVTASRCWSCLGGSIEIKFSMYWPFGLSPMAMVGKEEKAS